MNLEGKQAPDFTLPANGGKEITLSNYRGSYIVLYFYPKDMTPGCTTEACDFRDQTTLFEMEEAIVLGVSPIQQINMISSQKNINYHFL